MNIHSHIMEKDLSKRQSEIVHAAIKLIGAGGIQSLTIKNLSSEIGVAESAIYRHFSSKTEVLSTLLDYLAFIVNSQADSVSKLKTAPFEKIKKMIESHLKLFVDNPPYAVVVLSDGLYKNEKYLQERIINIMEKMKSTFLKIIDEGKKADEIRKDISTDQIAFIIMGSVRLTITQWSLSGFGFDLGKKGDEIFKTLKILFQDTKDHSKVF